MSELGFGIPEGKVFIILAIIVTLFIIRELNTWYWKINDVVDKLDDISKTLHRLEANNVNIKAEQEFKPND